MTYGPVREIRADPEARMRLDALASSGSGRGVYLRSTDTVLDTHRTICVPWDSLLTLADALVDLAEERDQRAGVT